jgi:hypothetical protein
LPKDEKYGGEIFRTLTESMSFFICRVVCSTLEIVKAASEFGKDTMKM